MFRPDVMDNLFLYGNAIVLQYIEETIFFYNVGGIKGLCQVVAIICLFLSTLTINTWTTA